MQMEPSAAGQPSRRPTEAEQERVAAALQEAVGAGRLTLAEFSDRVGQVWVAEDVAALQQTLEGLVDHPVTTGAPSSGTVVAVLGDEHRVGRWRLPARLRAIGLLGDVHLDLCAAAGVGPSVELRCWGILGDVEIVVPDGIEVELTGFGLLGDREVRLAPVPPLPGSPVVRIACYAVLGDVTVRSPGAAASRPTFWRRLGRPSR